ncbi:MAG: PilZ domain-containing protein [Deltaproteobacteria bacterium]|jgi:Tfp pilus assembly protein PilZ|nr:MAG: PilZ domain-containing protein [Deltaproteobacteria bacterium]
MNDIEKRLKDPNISVITARLFDLILKMSTLERQALLEKLEEKVHKGRRKATREQYFKDVDFATKDRVFRGFIQNISSDGVLIETSESLSVGQEITLAFELPNTNEHVKIAGKIARVLPDGGFGVKFNSTIKSLTAEKEKK